ncbi:MAG: NUDIX hydrolase YfcD [Proteobacteria bacterium]|nr:NUDIX hydrolase YfcD [Pseudomonadota bacterium]MBU4297087.1 NUDIX hydrolase YfcD [Pseudomonadota bacterium]MCG2749968.1 NUDIX hydrolase YfcD [Desulfobulbaceae bacterium]
MNTSKNPASEELVAIVDEENRVVGCASRGVMRRFHLIHRATYILLFNSLGELFVHQRTESKDVYPGYYDIAAGGVVQAGEDYDLSARRELAEEVGISGVPLTPLFDFYWQDDNNKVWGRAYSCVADGPITLQEEEVQWGRFMNVHDLRQLRAEKPFTPDGLYLLDRYLAQQAKSI